VPRLRPPLAREPQPPPLPPGNRPRTAALRGRAGWPTPALSFGGPQSAKGKGNLVSEVEGFITRWQGVTASELSTSQSFLIDLCRLLEVDVPHPTPGQEYMFERPITFSHGDGSTSAGRIDLYRRGAFVLESKKVRLGAHTKGFDDALLRARSQAEGYARALP